MSDDVEVLEGTIDLGGVLPVKPAELALKRRSCRECDYSFMESGDRVCRFMPPQVTFIALPEQKMMPTPQGPRPANVMALRNFTGFPIVQNEQWCGQFKQKVRS